MGSARLRTSKVSKFVSLHPYFNVRPERSMRSKLRSRASSGKTATEEKNLFYEFTVKGDEISAAKGRPMPRAFSRISIISVSY
jgi:hypothetical protein